MTGARQIIAVIMTFRKCNKNSLVGQTGKETPYIKIFLYVDIYSLGPNVIKNSKGLIFIEIRY
jgi:hypothetical protein